MKPEHSFVAERALANHCAELLRQSSPRDAHEALLGEFAQSLCRDLPERLAPLLAGVFPVVSTKSPELLTASALLRPAGSPQIHFRIDLAGIGLRLIATVDTAQARAITEFIFGGYGNDATHEAGAGPLPHSAVLVLEHILARLAETCEALLGPPDRPPPAGQAEISVVSRPLRDPPLPPPEYCIAWPLTIAASEDVSWTLRLAGLERIVLDLLALGRAQQRGKTDLAEAAKRMGGLPIRLTAGLAQFDLPLSRLASLGVGDMIAFTPNKEIPLQCGAKVLARGRMGVIGQHCALRLSQIG